MWYFRGWVAAPPNPRATSRPKKEVIDVEGKPNSTRFLELERRSKNSSRTFRRGPQKEAISVLHAMVQEASRRPASAPASEIELTLKDIANLYKSAPRMGGKAENEPLPVGMPAPDFELRDANGKLVRLSDCRGRTVVIAFYRSTGARPTAKRDEGAGLGSGGRPDCPRNYLLAANPASGGSGSV